MFIKLRARFIIGLASIPGLTLILAISTLVAIKNNILFHWLVFTVNQRHFIIRRYYFDFNNF